MRTSVNVDFILHEILAKTIENRENYDSYANPNNVYFPR